MSTSVKLFFMVKSFVTFYLIHYHKNAFRDKLFLIPFCKWGYISRVWQKITAKPQLRVAYKVLLIKNSVPRKKKQLVKKNSARKINFELSKCTF